ncbi:MAG TPA: FtsQ-type POTRA domain-containing protein [bacterium]|nr:FtsQ-type POTRA domain-containing protein [bacterium]HOR57125.1 FtsQ-type POTRA domain-containing protein [bacterium]HPL56079.1 FtsQ-type POTRA domain-containing protein [bacterium]
MALEYFYLRRRKGEKMEKRRGEKRPNSRYEIDYVRLKWVVVFFSFAVLLWWFFVSQVFVVKEIVYESEPSEPVVEKIEALKGKNILLLKTEELVASMQKELPIIKRMAIYRGLPDTLRIRVEERDRAIVWQSKENYYFIDTSGVAYEHAEGGKKESYLPIIDDSGIAVELGNRIVSSDFVATVQKIIDELPAKINNESIEEIHVGESTFSIAVLTSDNVMIKFDITQAVDTQIEAVRYIYSEKRGDVKQYIDVRVLGKAYIK